MFYLVNEKMDIAVSKRTEFSGDDKVNAYDAKLTGDFPNAVLLKLNERLRGVFYGPGAQGDVEQDYYPELLFPEMGAVSWGLEMSRIVLTIHDVDSDENDLELTDKELDKVKFTMKPGGTVTLQFRVVLGQLSEDELITLLRVDNQAVKISLEQAALVEKPDNYEQADLLSQEPHSAARQEAESLFGALPAGMKFARTPEELVNFPITPEEAERDTE